MRIKIDLSVNRVIQILLLFLFLVNAGQALFEPLYAVFVTGSVIGASLRTVGFATGLYAIAKSIIQLPLAKKIDKKVGERDDFFVLLTGSSMSFVSAIGLMFVRYTSQLYLLAILNGIGGACLAAAYYGIFARHIDRGAEGFEWSLFSVWGLTLSTALGGTLGGIVADAIGLRNTFLISAMVQFFATLLLIFLYPLLDSARKKADIEKIPMV